VFLVWGKTQVDTTFHIRIGRASRALVLSCLGLMATLWLVIAIGHSARTLVLVSLLAPIVAVEAWQVYHQSRALRRNARQHAQAAAEVERHYFQVLCEVVKIVEGRDDTRIGRSERIARLAEEMAPRVGVDPSRVKLLGMVGRVHDIGLLSVPERVLAKPGGLNGAEYRVVKEHAELGYRMLKPLTFLTEVLGAVRHHHERMNGSGYPDGLAGEDIPIEARVLAVADAYDAMTYGRPYRNALTPPQALGELIRCSGSGYDTRCIAALADTVHMAHLLPVNADADASPPDAAASPGDASQPLADVSVGS